MPFTISPGITVVESNLATVVPAVDTSVAAISGVFRWGPVGQRVLVTDERTLAATFGKPTDLNYETWLTASSFLAYSSALMVVRAANTTSTNGVFSAVANTSAVSNLNLQIVKTDADYESKDGTFDDGVLYVARYPGAMGNSLKVSVVDNANQFSSNLSLLTTGSGATLSINVGSNSASVVIAADSNTAATNAASDFAASYSNTDLFKIGNSSIGYQYMKVTGTTLGVATGNDVTGSITVTIGFEDPLKIKDDFSTTTSVTRYWEYWSLVKSAPGQSAWQLYSGNTSASDELHAVVVDEDGKVSGVPGTVLEVYQGVSRSTDAKDSSGLSNYYKDVINSRSKYLRWANDRSNAVSNTGVNLTSSTNQAPLVLSMVGGADGLDESNISVADLATGYDLFASAEDVDVGLVIAGKARGGVDNSQLANYIIDNICEVRKDCVAFISPDRDDVVGNAGGEADAVVSFAGNLRDTSYGFLDSGYKYCYDRYNDVYRYVPLCGDVAGLAARTDSTNDAWWSPAGFNRGQIKNLVRLAWNPSTQAVRDLLYKNRVNPVVSFEGMGTVLFGDETLLSDPSAFDRINVRRLFIVLEKAIATAAKYSLFEFNDDFTRAQFRNMVTPYLADIQGRRGLTSFNVVCDATNNTAEVVSQNHFVATIQVVPNYSINAIELQFQAVGPDVSFNEVVVNNS